MQTKKDIKYRQKKTSNTNARKTLNADKKGHYLKTPCKGGFFAPRFKHTVRGAVGKEVGAYVSVTS